MDLEKVRKAIDRIDNQLVALLNQRAKMSVEVSHQKRRTGSPVFAPDREAKLMQRIKALGKTGPLPPEALRAIYREIISASIALQAGLKIAYFGPEGSYTHEAAMNQFGTSPAYQPVRSIADVFREVERGRADYGVVPVENSTEGIVNHTLDMFVDSEAKVCAELSMKVVHNLLSLESQREKIKRVFIHPQTLAQCRNWLDGNLPEAELVEVSSNSRAAQMAATAKASAAIASRMAAKLYGLQILEPGIQDNASNITRFLVLGQQWPGPTGCDKTSLMLAIKDSVGALHKILQPFARHRVNLTSIESRPSLEKPWRYVFFMDALGHIQDPKMKKLLAALRPLTVTLKVLGSYPSVTERLGQEEKS